MPLPTHLYHYYEKAQGPFKNLTENGAEQATEIQNQITEGWNSNRPENYVDLRLALEARIKKLFQEKGGIATRNDPFYLTLGECQWAETWYSDPAVVTIPLADVDPKHLSFTYPDSMVSFQFFDEPKLATYRKACNGQVFLLDELEPLLGQYGLPNPAKWESIEADKYDRYIEAQIWDDALIQQFR